MEPLDRSPWLQEARHLRSVPVLLLMPMLMVLMLARWWLCHAIGMGGRVGEGRKGKIWVESRERETNPGRGGIRGDENMPRLKAEGCCQRPVGKPHELFVALLLGLPLAVGQGHLAPSLDLGGGDWGVEGICLHPVSHSAAHGYPPTSHHLKLRGNSVSDMPPLPPRS